MNIYLQNLPEHVRPIVKKCIEENLLNTHTILEFNKKYNIDLTTYLIDKRNVKDMSMEELKYIIESTEIKTDNFIETGTYKGDTTILAAELFNRTFTFEIVEELYFQNKRRFATLNIIDYLIDSIKILPLLIPELKDDCMYFLDAHISGLDTTSTEIEVPLMEELECIIKYNKCQNIVIIIDDSRFFTCHNNAKPSDWKHISIEKIENLLNSNNHKIVQAFTIADRIVYKINYNNIVL